MMCRQFTEKSLKKHTRWQKMPDPHSLLIEKLREKHSGDEKQLAVVFSSSPRLLVEAPAGYGKTKTMISRIAYLLATGQIAYPKRLLALTFSVNAAYKIKKDVIQQIPELLKDAQINFNFNERIFVSNYHGFCRNVLRRHGYAFSEYLSSIDAFETNDDADSKILMEWEGKLTIAEATLMSDFNKAVKNIDATFVKNNLGQYCEIIISKLLPSRKMTFNGILTLTINLFDKFPTVREFYN
jgi:DNA helicase-2/ATP-dependent DNA helicase PcrA